LAKSKEAQSIMDLVTNVPTQEEFWDLVGLAVEARLVPIGYGPPGVGKSEGAKVLAEDRNWGITRVIVGSQCVPEDVNGAMLEGCRVTDGSGREMPTTEFAVRKTFHELNQHGGLLILDEFTNNPPAVQATFLRLLAEGVAGEYQLIRDKVATIALANPVDMAANGTDLPPPMANRLVHLGFPCGEEARVEWCQKFPGYWGRPPVIEFAGRKLPEAEYMRARAYVAGYLSRKTVAAWQGFPEDAVQQSGPWPSARAWDGVARAIARVAENKRPVYEAAPLVGGLIGPGAAAEFLVFLKDQDLPDPVHLLNNPQSYKPGNRPDITFATLIAVAETLKARFSVAWFEAAIVIILDKAAKEGKSLEAAAVPYKILTGVMEERYGLKGADRLPDRSYQLFAAASDAMRPMTKVLRESAPKKG
jgi:MoxR-like ATPase